jgi:hypothetical protein
VDADEYRRDDGQCAVDWRIRSRMGLIMDKRIIDIVSNFSAWKGDTYRLAA